MEKPIILTDPITELLKTNVGDIYEQKDSRGSRVEAWVIGPSKEPADCFDCLFTVEFKGTVIASRIVPLSCWKLAKMTYTGNQNPCLVQKTG